MRHADARPRGRHTFFALPDRQQDTTAKTLATVWLGSPLPTAPGPTDAMLRTCALAGVAVEGRIAVHTSPEAACCASGQPVRVFARRLDQTTVAPAWPSTSHPVTQAPTALQSWAWPWEAATSSG